MAELCWMSAVDGYVEINGRPAGVRGQELMRRLDAAETGAEFDAAVEWWYRMPRVRSAYRAKRRGWRRG